MSILKYAMTLDGKIATQTGHSAWVTSPPARAQVFEQRARSDAVIVGGNTVRCKYDLVSEDAKGSSHEADHCSRGTPDHGRISKWAAGQLIASALPVLLCHM